MVAIDTFQLFDAFRDHVYSLLRAIFIHGIIKEFGNGVASNVFQLPIAYSE